MIDLIKVKEAAEMLRVSKPQVYLLCKQDGFPSLRLGGKKKTIRIDRQGLIKWIEAQHEKPIIPTD